MSMIDIHRVAREDTRSIVLHEFKERYKKRSKVIYGFVEGKDDPCFYKGFIENVIPEDWKVELWPSGNKKTVYEVFEWFDWSSFNPSQIIFFVDRDLSIFLEEKSISANNIFVTDNYSIENDIVNKNTCDRVLREVCGLSALKYQDSDKILDLFETQLEIFQKALIPVMSNVIFWRKNQLNACLDNICMKHIFDIKCGKIIIKQNPKSMNDIVHYIHHQCNLHLCDQTKVIDIAKHFEENFYFRRFIRGKYLLWFIVEFCLSIHSDYESIDFLHLEKKPKNNANLSHSTAIIHMAPRSKIPYNLKLFFENTFKKYIVDLDNV